MGTTSARNSCCTRLCFIDLVNAVILKRTKNQTPMTSIAQLHPENKRRPLAIRCTNLMLFASLAAIALFVYHDHKLAVYSPVILDYPALTILLLTLTLTFFLEYLRLGPRLIGVCPYCEDSCTAYVRSKELKCLACSGTIQSKFDTERQQATWSRLPGAELRLQNKTWLYHLAATIKRKGDEPYLCLKLMVPLGILGCIYVAYLITIAKGSLP